MEMGGGGTAFSSPLDNFLGPFHCLDRGGGPVPAALSFSPSPSGADSGIDVGGDPGFLLALLEKKRYHR